MDFKQKPNTLVCYICGREFGTKSLQIHIKSCQTKFQQEQSLKQKKDRRTLPQQPPLLRELLSGNLENLQIYNQQAIQIHKYQVLPACKFCGRTFNEESLKVHINACPKKVNTEPPKKSYEEETKKPRTLACCVCGREFGLTSLKIHYPQCIQKFENEQSKKSRQQRRKTPVFSPNDIDLFGNKIDWTSQDIQAFNAKAMSIFRQKGMIHCQICRRSFMPQPYQKHLRNCKQNNKNYKQPIIEQTSFQTQIKKPKVLVCHICGRQFGLSSLTIHQKTCREKFLNGQKAKTKSQRKPLPTLSVEVLAKFSLQDSDKWSVQKIQEYNKICTEVYRNQSMVECSICKRKFIETAYLKHKNYCEKNNKPVIIQEPKQEISESQPEKKITKQTKQKTKQIKVENVISQKAEQLQQTVIFQDIKHPTCNQKKKQIKDSANVTVSPIVSEHKINQDFKKQAQKSKKQIEPEKQKITEQVIKNQSNLIEESIQLQACEKCGRKFLAERLQKHISVCKGSKAIPNFKQKIVNRPKEQQENNYQSQRVESKKHIQQQAPQTHSKQLAPCSKCGRRFLQNRVAKHEECCKGKQVAPKETQRQSRNDNVKQHEKKNSQLFQKLNDKPPPHNQEERSKQPSSVEAHNNQSFQAIDLKSCSKCERKFAIDRLQVHENICKGKPKLKIDPPQKAKTIQVIKKTKENFFKMVQDIKSKKIKQQQIDKQLDEELQTLGNTQVNSKVGELRNKKQNESKQLQMDVIRSNAKQIDPQKISKWRRQNVVKRSPEKQYKKQGRGQSHLPKI